MKSVIELWQERKKDLKSVAELWQEIKDHPDFICGHVYVVRDVENFLDDMGAELNPEEERIFLDGIKEVNSDGLDDQEEVWKEYLMSVWQEEVPEKES